MPSKDPAQRLTHGSMKQDGYYREHRRDPHFTPDLDLPAFRADRKTVYAAVRALEIISEASRRLPAVAAPSPGDRLGGSGSRREC
jgi:hypothetical protein